MKHKAMAIASIILILSVVATIMTFSFAWFSQKSSVDTDGSSFQAAQAGNVSILVGDSDNVLYMGETGESGDPFNLDFPYRAYKTFSATFNFDGEKALASKINRIAIFTSDYDGEKGEINHENLEMTEGLFHSEVDNSIINNFTWRLYLVDETVADGRNFHKTKFGDWKDEEDNDVDSGNFTCFYPSQCFGKNDTIARTADGKAFNDFALLPGEDTYTFVVEIIFLDSDSYCKQQLESGDLHPTHTIENEPRVFAYSDSSFMNSLFAISFMVGADTLKVEE